MVITEAAQNKVDQVLNGEGFLEVCLEGGGCSGYQIKLKGTSEIPSDAQMDWDDDPFKPSFKFTPPTGSHSCGCGSSFQLD